MTTQCSSIRILFQNIHKYMTNMHKYMANLTGKLVKVAKLKFHQRCGYRKRKIVQILRSYQLWDGDKHQQKLFQQRKLFPIF